MNVNSRLILILIRRLTRCEACREQEKIRTVQGGGLALIAVIILKTQLALFSQVTYRDHCCDCIMYQFFVSFSTGCMKLKVPSQV